MRRQREYPRSPTTWVSNSTAVPPAERVSKVPHDLGVKFYSSASQDPASQLDVCIDNNPHTYRKRTQKPRQDTRQSPTILAAYLLGRNLSARSWMMLRVLRLAPSLASRYLHQDLSR